MSVTARQSGCTYDEACLLIYFMSLATQQKLEVGTVRF